MSDRIVKDKIGGVKKKSMDGKEAQELRLRINAHAKKVVAERFLEASIPDHSSRFPNFSAQDVVRGQYLGKGKFGMVYEVLALDGGVSRLTSSNPKWFHRPTKKGFTATTKVLGHPKESEDDDEIYDLDSSSDADKHDGTLSLDGTTFETREHEGRDVEARMRKKQEEARTFMNDHCLREENGKPRYAMKVLSPEVLDEPTTLYYQGIMDMAGETRLLSTIRHPHIIKLRGIGNDPYTENFFLILDRLYQTLEQRWKHWQKLHRRHSCLWGLTDRRGRLRAAQYQERMVCSHDLASGLAYLHSKKIIHRDIKSDNIGFDVRGDIKIFDFGLSRELPPQNKATPDGTWKMTGSTGTPRYMCPEVALEQSYNEACDTYSFCILLWEMMSLETAFEHYTWISFRERVWKEPHKRPFLHPTVWSKEMQAMVQQGWHGDLKQRMPMTEIVETLRQEVIRRGGFDDEWGLVFERRSTHIFDEGDAQYLQGGHDSFLSMFASPLRSVRLSMISTKTSSRSPQSIKSSKVDMTAATQTIDPSEFNSPRLMVSNPSLLSLELPLASLDGDDMKSSRDEEASRERATAMASHAAIFEQVKAETLRRKRESILGKSIIEVRDDDVNESDVRTKDAFSILNQSSPSMIYQEVKDETVRRERARILGTKREQPRSERLLRAVRVVRSRKDSIGDSDRSSSGIWERIEEENVRQTELRSRLSLNRDVVQ